LVERNGNYAVLLAVDDWNRTAPESLTRHQPITKAVIHLGDSVRLSREIVTRLLHRLDDAESVEETGVDVYAVT